MLFFGQRQLGLTRLGGNGCTVPFNSQPTTVYILYDSLIRELLSFDRGIRPVPVIDLENDTNKQKNGLTDAQILATQASGIRENINKMLEIKENYNALIEYDRFPEFDFSNK